ncbi:MAG: hypothetical protein IT341_10610 [Chloroflexi bacterium]|nr:hypothetical protein [Chloroflexota bacterium]
MNVSIAIMAHPQRAAWVAELQAQLGDVPVAWAEPPYATKRDRGPCWRTKRAALLLHTDAPFHCVIQDDAIPCSDFVDHLEQLIQRGERVYGLFYRHKRTWPEAIARANVALRHGRGVFAHNNILGPGVVVPTHRIADLIAFCDELDPTLGDDDRMKLWLRANDEEALFALPSLVDHRVGPSFIGHPEHRTAWVFQA